MSCWKSITGHTFDLCCYRTAIRGISTLGVPVLPLCMAQASHYSSMCGAPARSPPRSLPWLDIPLPCCLVLWSVPLWPLPCHSLGPAPMVESCGEIGFIDRNGCTLNNFLVAELYWSCWSNNHASQYFYSIDPQQQVKSYHVLPAHWTQLLSSSCSQSFSLKTGIDLHQFHEQPVSISAEHFSPST